jgi:hypothetical protein
VNKIHKIRVLFTMESIPIHEIHVSIRILGHKMCVFVRYICVSEEVYVLDVNSLPNVNHGCPNFHIVNEDLDVKPSIANNIDKK